MTETKTDNEQTKPLRHSWDKVIYNGKYSSFEKRATCKVCGCEREKIMYGYEYKLNGVTTYKAPPCISI